MPHHVTCSCGQPITVDQIAALHKAAVIMMQLSGKTPTDLVTDCTGCGAKFGLLLEPGQGYHLLQVYVPGILAHKHTNSVN